MSELQFTAYHEAGHAVIAVMLGGRVRQVTVEPPNDDGPNRYGDTIIEWSMAGISPQNHALREVKAVLAGPAAEAVYRDEYRELRITQESSADWITASQQAHILFSGRSTSHDLSPPNVSATCSSLAQR